MTSKITWNFKLLDKHDILNQIFLLIITVIIIINNDKISGWFYYVVINVLLSVFTICIVLKYEKLEFSDKYYSRFLKILRYWYPLIMIFFYFKEIYVIMIKVSDFLYDDLLISIDYMIFNSNPTQELFGISNPFLTEFLQIIYNLFYLMPVIYGLELYLWHRYREFKFATFLILLGFYLSFFGYLILPAIGPRFTLHNFADLNLEMPGVFLTEMLRDIINFGESIYPKNIPNPETIAQRDAFPSGHTIILLLITYLSAKFKSNSFYFYLPFSVIMVFATVYLRYHYVIDIIAGFVIALISVFIAKRVYKNEPDNNDIIRST
ncbi:MAG: phosphatase PAP2 family protein [Ignavibacteria bacterium]|nr:phosphatase PAP2 family protein [Ignavibacteria bacterium]